MKDVNFAIMNEAIIQEKINGGKGVINLPQKTIDKINSDIAKDVAFLQSMGLMDYSLYVVVESRHDRTLASRLNASSGKLILRPRRNAFRSYDSNEVYHIGIIDYL